MRYLFVLFIVMPIVEMWLLITVGQQIGALPTIGLVLLTAVVGLSLLRQQGFATLFRARTKLDAGELPALEMAEALILAICGALLLTPGFVTDVVGFAGLVPVVRRRLVSLLVARMEVVSYSEYQVRRPGERQSSDDKGQVVEGEYWRDNDDRKLPK
ncbi:MAG: FxsA family protein [Gammaproteobacteria bacterium]|nr:MAG: FxsA family protein [Gammaproteobacteria bacterium]